MSVVTRTVNDVVKRAYELLGIVGQNVPLNGYQADLGVEILNELFDSFASGGFTIPTFKEFTFTMVSGERDYLFAPSLPTSPADNMNLQNRIIELNRVQVQYSGNTSLYPVRISDENSVAFNQVVLTSRGRPTQCALTRQLSDSTVPVPYSRIRFDIPPDQAFTCYVRAKLYLNYVEIGDVLTEIPANMHLYLSYEIAYNLLNIYESANWTPQKEAKYQELKDMFTQAVDFDLTIDSSDILRSHSSWYNRRLVDG